MANERIVPLVGVGCLAFIGVAGCQKQTDPSSLDVEVRQEALTAAGNRIVGFENPTVDWSITQGSIPALQKSSTHTQGTSSLAVLAKNFVVVKSAAFPVTTAIEGPLLYDFFLPSQQPNPSWFGASQLYLDCPAKNISNAFIGQQELTGLPTNQFSTLSFDLPAALATQLAGGCSNLDFRISLDVPSNATGTYRLDNLHFRGSGGNVAATLDCVAKLSATQYQAFFGYRNLENFALFIAVGPDNRVTPAPPARGQPTRFLPGTQVDAVAVDFVAGQTAKWQLPAGAATATASSTLCPGTTATPTACEGIPVTSDAGCATVIKLPNATGPNRDPAVLGIPIDPADLPKDAGAENEEDHEAAIDSTVMSPSTTFTLPPQGIKSTSISISAQSTVSARALWHAPATVTLSLTQGSKTVTGSRNDLGSHGGVVKASSVFPSGSVQVKVQNTGSQHATITLDIARLTVTP
jgi:hypothetical protein